MSQTSRKRSQWIVAAGLGALALGGLWFVSQILNNPDGGFTSVHSQSGVSTTMIADRTRAASPEMSWINAANDKVDKLTSDVERLSEVLRITSENAEAVRLREQKETDKLLASYENKIVSLETQLNTVAQGARRASTQTASANGISFKTGQPLGEFLSTTAASRTPLNPLGATGGQGTPAGGTGVSLPTSFQPLPFARDFALTAAAAPEETEEKLYLASYLPAGSYAPALVLSGVDASTAVTSQAEPVPVVFRITGAAITAGTRSLRGHTIDLTGCTVTGSARGDLSSERVYVRLLKLSCIQSNGRVFERDVAGYMSGAGKAGARGRVVSREGPLVRNAGIAGALGGLAEGLSSVTDAASGSDAASFQEALQGAGAASVSGGISGAADRLSEYYIERAEQYQPVVSLYGGTHVELVFMEGVDLG